MESTDATDVALRKYTGNQKITSFIVDLDGTMALHTETDRGHYEYSKVMNDEPNYPIIEVVEAYARVTGRTPVFTTGRPEVDENVNVRALTTDWIVENTIFIPDWFKLVMRKQYLVGTNKRDFRPDDIVKEELYRAEIEPYCDISVVFDDRDRVVKMWRRLGLTCLQVAPGNF